MTGNDEIRSFPPGDGRIRVTRWHLSNYPWMMSKDLVKMIFQSVFGNHHIQRNLSSIEESIQRELDQKNHPTESKRLVDPLEPNRGWMRIHLFPFMDGGGDAKALAESVLLSARIHPGSTREFIEFIKVAQFTLKMDDYDIGFDDLPDWEERCRASGFSPVGHSSHYRRHYDPAYRVIHTSMLENPKMHWVRHLVQNDNLLKTGVKDE